MSQGITYQDVANAAISLLEEKQHPTLDRIREYLGTGSKSTIARHFRAWKLKNTEADDEDVPQELTGLVKELWSQVKAKGDHRIEKIELNSEKIIEKLREELIEVQKNYADLEKEQHLLQNKLQKQLQQTEELQQAFDAEKLLHEKLKTSYEALSKQHDEKNEEVLRLHQLLQNVQANLENYQTAMQKLREEQNLAADKQRNAYEHDITELRHELALLSTQANQYQGKCEQLAIQLDDITQEYKNISTENSNLQQQLQEKTITETTLLNRYADLQQICREQKISIEKHSTSTVVYEKRIAVLSDQVEKLKHSLEVAEDKITALRDDKLFLTHEKAHLEGLLKRDN